MFLDSVLPLCAILCTQVVAAGQDSEGRDTTKDQHVARAIEQWVDDFGRSRLGPRGLLRSGLRLQPDYYLHARKAGMVSERGLGRVTHLDMLQKLLFHAEKHPAAGMGEAVLSVASVGLERSFLDRTAFELRELGHWTLMRMEDQGVWFQVLRAASGDRVPIFDELRSGEKPEEAVSVGPARRVAALRLLGQRGLPVFRSTLEAALIAKDPRVRLAAAESIRPPWKVATVKRVANATKNERHPVVSQAMVRLLSQMLKRPPSKMSASVRSSIMTGALAQIGLAG